MTRGAATPVEEGLDGKLARLERDRGHAMGIAWRWIGLVTLATALGAVWAYQRDPEAIFYVILAGIVVAFFVRHTHAAGIKAKFKGHVVPRVLSGLDPRLEHGPGGISKEEFAGAALFGTSSRFVSGDLVHGYLGATPVRLAYVDADRKGLLDTSHQLMFAGIYLAVAMPNPGGGRVVIRTNRLGIMPMLTYDRVTFGHAEFDGAFMVEAEDADEARNFLTHERRAALAALAVQHGEVNATLAGGRFSIAIPWAANPCEPDLANDFDRSQAQSIDARLREAFGIVDRLGLAWPQPGTPATA